MRADLDQTASAAADIGIPRGIVLERIVPGEAQWEAIMAGHRDSTVFHGFAWLDFLAASQGAEPVMAAVTVDGGQSGYFAGAIVRRMGIRILGSPLPGWSTPHMGFLLDEGVDRRSAADALLRFAFRDLGCQHVEIDDQLLTVGHMDGSGWSAEPWVSYLVDLEPPEDDILARMNPHRRQYMRRAVRRGMVAEVATEIGFADEYHAQLLDVFARQGLRPAQDVQTVRHLIRCLQPSGQLLMLRVRGPDGSSIATMLSVGYGSTAVAWGAALLREHAEHHPMELLWWESMRHWRARGASCFDLNSRADYGRGDYKAKYGGVAVDRARFFRSRSSVLRYGREAVRRMVRTRQSVLGHLDPRSRRARDRSPGNQTAG